MKVNQNTKHQKIPIVSMISNYLSTNHRDLLRERNGYLSDGVLNPFEFSYNNIHGIVPIIDIIPEELFSSSGMRKAKEYFINAVENSIERGVKVILLAASTKRLFGNGSELKTMFPNIVFTIGDNGTALAFIKQIDYVIKNRSVDSPVIVVGTGFLGETAIGFLKANGFKKVIIISRQNKKIYPNYSIHETLDNYINSTDFEGASLLLGCAHNHNIQFYQLKQLIREQLIIIDVAVPKAVPFSITSLLDKNVSRFDGGDFEIKNLKLHFQPQLAGLNFEGEFYGCFTEALLLALSNYKGDNDFFHITENNMKLIQTLANDCYPDFGISMKNFGQPVSGFKELLECV